MKKKFMLVSLIAVIGLGTFLLSCSKDDDTFRGCTCTEIWDDGSRNTFTVSAAEAQQYGATNCNQVAGLEMAWGAGDLVSVNCSNL